MSSTRWSRKFAQNSSSNFTRSRCCISDCSLLLLQLIESPTEAHRLRERTVEILERYANGISWFEGELLGLSCLCWQFTFSQLRAEWSLLNLASRFFSLLEETRGLRNRTNRPNSLRSLGLCYLGHSSSEKGPFLGHPSCFERFANWGRSLTGKLNPQGNPGFVELDSTQRLFVLARLLKEASQVWVEGSILYLLGRKRFRTCHKTYPSELPP